MTVKEKDLILLAEPDEFLADIYKKNLALEGFEVLVVAGRERILKIAETKKPSLIVMEIILRDADGFSVLEELKSNKNTKNIPVIFLTKLGGREELSKGMSLGAVGFIIKQHFRPSELVDKIKKILSL